MFPSCRTWAGKRQSTGKSWESESCSLNAEPAQKDRLTAMNRPRRSKTEPLLIFFIQRNSSTNWKRPHTSNLVEFNGWRAFKPPYCTGLLFRISLTTETRQASAPDRSGMTILPLESHLEHDDTRPKPGRQSIPTSPLKSTHSLPHYEGPIKARTAKGLRWRATLNWSQT